MKVLLLRPPYKFVTGSARPSIGLPLGLLYIAAVLERNTYSVHVYDAQLNVDAPLSRDANGNIHMGDIWEDVRRKIAEHDPDIVGITCTFTAQWENAVRAAEIVKEMRSDILVVVGGNYPSARPEDFFLKTGAFDIVCRGEGEYTMLEIVRRFYNREDLGDIDGTVVRKGDGLAHNRQRPFIENLDEIPFPAYHLINLEDYFSLYKRGLTNRPVMNHDGSDRCVSFISSRGCPFNCVFCSIHIHMGKKWRYHSAEYVVNHLRQLVSTYNVRHVHFEDDNLTYRKERFESILDGCTERDISFIWDTPNGVRADTLTPGLISKCADTGCAYLILGVESGNQEVLSNIVGKRLKLNVVENVALWCKQAHIDTMAFFVIGFPDETRRDMLDTVEFALMLQKRYDVTPSVFVATPLPGTRLEKLCFEKGILRSEMSSEQLARMTQGMFLQDGNSFTAEDLKEMLGLFYGGYKKYFIWNALRFLSRHPSALIKFLRIICRGRKMGRAFLIDTLQYKNNLLRSFKTAI